MLFLSPIRGVFLFQNISSLLVKAWRHSILCIAASYKPKSSLQGNEMYWFSFLRRDVITILILLSKCFLSFTGYLDFFSAPMTISSSDHHRRNCVCRYRIKMIRCDHPPPHSLLRQDDWLPCVSLDFLFRNVIIFFSGLHATKIIGCPSNYDTGNIRLATKTVPLTLPHLLFGRCSFILLEGQHILFVCRWVGKNKLFFSWPSRVSSEELEWWYFF